MEPLAASCSGPHPHQTPCPASKNSTFVESSLWDWLVVAVILHQILFRLQILYKGPTDTYIEASIK